MLQTTTKTCLKNCKCELYPQACSNKCEQPEFPWHKDSAQLIKESGLDTNGILVLQHLKMSLVFLMQKRCTCVCAQHGPYLRPLHNDHKGCTSTRENYLCGKINK